MLTERETKKRLLNLATQWDMKPTIQYIKKYNKNPEIKTQQWETLLMLASKAWDKEAIILLIKYWEDINEINNAWVNALMFAINHNNIDILERLADKESINHTDKKWNTPYSLAKNRKNGKAIEILKDLWADTSLQ